LYEKTTVRPSVALPRILVAEALAAVPPALRGNLNILVKEALREYIVHSKALEFEQAPVCQDSVRVKAEETGLPKGHSLPVFPAALTGFESA